MASDQQEAKSETASELYLVRLLESHSHEERSDNHRDKHFVCYHSSPEREFGGYEYLPHVNFLVDELCNQLEKSFNIADGQGNLIERDRIEISLHDIT